MNADESLARQFEADRAHLRGLAYRLLGSMHDADDAVQAAWLKVGQSGLPDVANPTGWFTTVTARVCLDQLRARKRRGEVPLDGTSPALPSAAAADEEVALAESVGRALIVVLDRLSPAQRVAVVLHDMFAIPFEEIGELLDRSPVAAKKLASRARQRLRGNPSGSPRPPAEHLRIADAFLSASQHGNFPALLELLAPNVIRRVDRILVPPEVPTELRGASEFVEEAAVFAARARGGAVAVVDGLAGVVIAPTGRLETVVRLSIRDGHIELIDIIGEPQRLAAITVALA